jgi:glycosyltransferase involved in cell wall biosynthesis
MKLLILTSAPLSATTGPQARLTYELKDLALLHDITIISLGQQPDDAITTSHYPTITFKHFPISYDGWSVVNKDQIVDFVQSEAIAHSHELVILQMEIWDLMRELSNVLKKIVPFATIIHAMPFLGAPLEPLRDFATDVTRFANSAIETYRKEYILKHYAEAENVLKNCHIIANNQTVAFYMRKYFPTLQVSEQSISLNNPLSLRYNTKPEFDFTFMARMEKGKGLEFLTAITQKASSLLNRKVTLALAGKADDAFSKHTLTKLLNQKYKEFVEITFFGWADPFTKLKLLSNTAVFIYPSYYDNYPTVLTEALVHGLPCVVWDTLYSSLNFFDFPTVLTVHLKNTDAFADTAVQALNNRKALFSKSSNFFKKFDSADIIAQKDTILFEKIIQLYDREN